MGNGPFRSFHLCAFVAHSVFSPPPSPAPLRGAGERRNTLTSRGLHPRLSASRPCGACPSSSCGCAQDRLKGGTSFSDSLSVSISVSLTLPDALTVVWHNAML